MESNFDFLKDIDKSLYEIILDSERLFRDEYFNQSIINTRIFAETIAKKLYDKNDSNMTFDDILNCLKDSIQTQREKEFIEDLFFIKKEGNKCAHGEDTESTTNLEVLKRAFEISINYANKLTKENKYDDLEFDFDLLMSQKRKEKKLINEYLNRANANILDEKENEFISKAKNSKTNYTKIKSVDNYKAAKKETQKRIKEKIKKAKTNLKNTINKKSKKSKNKASLYKKIIFIIFTLISIFLIWKMIF